MENIKTKYKGYVYAYISAMGKINRKIYMANLIKKLCLLLIILGSCVESILIYYYITKRKKAEFLSKNITRKVISFVNAMNEIVIIFICLEILLMVAAYAYEYMCERKKILLINDLVGMLSINEKGMKISNFYIKGR